MTGGGGPTTAEIAGEMPRAEPVDTIGAFGQLQRESMILIRQQAEQSCRPSRKGVALWGVFGLLLGVCIYFTATGETSRLLHAISDMGFIGALILVVIYAITMVMIVPVGGTILNLAAGALYGAVVGYAVVVVGCAVGAALCFWLGRGSLKDWVRGKVANNDTVTRLCRMMGGSSSQRDAFTIVLVSRLPPVMPFALINYAYAITDVSFPVFIVATSIGVSPACFLEAYIGYLIGDLAEVIGDSDTTSQTGGTEGDSADVKAAKEMQLAVGAVLTVVSTVVLVILGNRMYRRLEAAEEGRTSTTGGAGDLNQSMYSDSNNASKGGGIAATAASPLKEGLVSGD